MGVRLQKKSQWYSMHLDIEHKMFHSWSHLENDGQSQQKHPLIRHGIPRKRHCSGRHLLLCRTAVYTGDPLFVSIPTVSRREPQTGSNYKMLTMTHFSRPKSKLNTQPLRQKLDGNIWISNIKLQNFLPCPCLPLKLQTSTNSLYWLWRNLPLLNRVQL